MPLDHKEGHQPSQQHHSDTLKQKKGHDWTAQKTWDIVKFECNRIIFLTRRAGGIIQFLILKGGTVGKVSQSNKLSRDSAFHLPSYVVPIFQSYYDFIGFYFRGHTILPFTIEINIAENSKKLNIHFCLLQRSTFHPHKEEHQTEYSVF